MNYYKIFRLIVSITYLSVFLCTELAAQQTARVFPEIPPSVLSVAMKDYKDGQDPMDSRLPGQAPPVWARKPPDGDPPDGYPESAAAPLSR